MDLCFFSCCLQFTLYCMNKTNYVTRNVCEGSANLVGGSSRILAQIFGINILRKCDKIFKNLACCCSSLWFTKCVLPELDLRTDFVMNKKLAGKLHLERENAWQSEWKFEIWKIRNFLASAKTCFGCEEQKKPLRQWKWKSTFNHISSS